jgi:APA family basic amino acid/polyamine antiporter
MAEALRSPDPPEPADSPTAAEGQRLVRALGPVEGTMIVVGTVIGSGIFLTPNGIAQKVGDYGFGMVLMVWVVGGLLSLAGALAFAELSAMFPRSGGQYVFIREAYGPLWGFLYGWMEFWVARSGSIAVLAVAFATAAGAFVPLDGAGLRWTGFLAVFILTIGNYLGVRVGGAIQVLFTAVKVAALGALVVCAFALPVGSPRNWAPVWGAGAGDTGLWGALGAAMIAVLWSYDGWTNGAAVSEEMQEPQRNVPRALIGGTLLITALYLTANLAYHYVLPMEAIRNSKLVGTDVAEALFGPVGGGLLSAAVMASTFGAANGLMLTGPRIFFAMARDGVFFHDLARLHPIHHTPDRAILLQGLWAGLLVLVPFGELARTYLGWPIQGELYDQLFTFVIFASWLFYGMAVGALLILRARRPEAERPYRTWGYPLAPLLFVLASAALTLHTLIHSPWESLAGLGIIAVGLPAYWWWRRQAAEVRL